MNRKKQLTPYTTRIIYDPHETIGYYYFGKCRFIYNRNCSTIFGILWLVGGILSTLGIFSIIPKVYSLLCIFTILAPLFYGYLMINWTLLNHVIRTFEFLYRQTNVLIFLVSITLMTTDLLIIAYLFIMCFSLNVIHFIDTLPDKTRRSLSIFSFPFGIIFCVVLLLSLYLNLLEFENSIIQFSYMKYNLISVASSVILNLLIFFIKNYISILYNKNKMISISTNMICTDVNIVMVSS
jgi:hypothetical protein